MIILCSAFGLHALHFTTGFCTLCIWCCIIEMQATFLFTKACQRTVPASQILSSQICLSMLEYTEQPLTPKVGEIEFKGVQKLLCAYC